LQEELFASPHAPPVSTSCAPTSPREES